jgi:hypothetical protein
MLFNNWKEYPLSAWRWPSFSPRELACKGTGRLRVDPASMDKLQALRDQLGVPLIVTSGYRSPEHNKKVGGAKNSLHMRGMAFDIRMDNHDPVAFEEAARAVGFKGIRRYPKQGFLHIDTRSEPHDWGDPFPLGENSLPKEPENRETVAQSSTVQASAVQIATGAGGAVAAVGSLDGTAQIVALVLAGIVILAGAWIMRERLKAWSAGWR